MSCCWSKAAVDVVGHEADPESSQSIIILGTTGRSVHPHPRPVVNQGSKTSHISTVSFISTAAQVDFPDEEPPQRVRKHFATKSQLVSASAGTEIVWKPQGTLITADASDGLQDEFYRGSRAESDVTDSCLLSASRDPANVVRWDGRLFSNNDITPHDGSYFPVIVNVENGELFAFNNNQFHWQEHESPRDNNKHSEWLAMPGIGFLPNAVVDIIAGDGGLLCVNGGTQPRKRNLHTPPIPHAEDYNHRLYPQQSILVVCNPLTGDIKFLPRHTNKKLDGKIACLQILGESKKVSRLRYRIHVVGGHHERASLRGPASDELVLMTYDSRADTWISGMAVGRARIPAFAKTGIARVEEGFYLGGQEESEEVRDTKGNNNKRMSSSHSRGQYQGGGAFGGQRCPVWINKIFYVQASTFRWHSVDFEILGEDGLPHPEPLQAPRVLQCQTGGPVYAVTRAKEAAKTIEIYEVVIVGGFPTGEFHPVTKMPGDIFMNLFESETSMREYDCAAGHDYICFLVAPPNQSTIGVCDLRRQKWFMSIFPADPHGTGHYALGKSMWTPSWKVQS